MKSVFIYISMITASSPRSLRIEDEIWAPAMQQAKKLGVSLTFVIKNYLKNFAATKDPIIVIDEGGIPLSSEMQKKVDALGELATQQVKKRLLSQQ